jgi:hypothetical protein
MLRFERALRPSVLGLVVGLVPLGCHATTLADAEKKGDVQWLDGNGSPEAIAAIGRIADSSAAAVDTLTTRAAYDVNAYIAAWTATTRGAAWGPALLRAGLADPERADTAASTMGRRDVHLAAFVPDLEASLMRIAASSRNGAVSSVLASAGDAASAAIQRRLADAATRGAICRGIGSPDASGEALKVLMSVPASSRNNESCVQAVLRIAVENDGVLDWLAKSAEPGLLSAAGRSAEFPCPRLKTLWTTALGSRAATEQATLTVPLGNAVSRCAPELDKTLADALSHSYATHPLIVDAVDPFGSEIADLKATCTALKSVANGRDSSIVRQRADEALSHGCQSAR